MSKLNDITGQRFGRLTAVSWERVLYANRVQVLWICTCDCGNTIRSASSALKRGNPKSCGCWIAEETSARNRTHGMGRTPVYAVWTTMIARCTNPKNISYPNYGGRGIRVCERWRDFANFFADMGDRPSATHQIDRIDNAGHYEPGNCKWSDRVEQGENKRNNILITARGKTLTPPQWAKIIGIPATTLRRRYALGWDHEDIVSRPLRHVTVANTGRSAQT